MWEGRSEEKQEQKDGLSTSLAQMPPSPMSATPFHHSPNA
jgi:hypothetical protein